jgi:predicted amidohydrolase
MKFRLRLSIALSFLATVLPITIFAASSSMPGKRLIRVAVCQIFCLDGDRSGNLTRIENAIHEAKLADADIACFPETALLGWVNPDLVLIPYGWAAKEEQWPEHGKELKKTVSKAARTIGAPVAGVDLVGEITHGPWTGMTYGGQSVAANAQGEIIAIAKDRDREVMIVQFILMIPEDKHDNKTKRFFKNSRDCRDWINGFSRILCPKILG